MLVGLAVLAVVADGMLALAGLAQLDREMLVVLGKETQHRTTQVLVVAQVQLEQMQALVALAFQTQLLALLFSMQVVAAQQTGLVQFGLEATEAVDKVVAVELRVQALQILVVAVAAVVTAQ